jgi:hypothetical protein
MFDTAKLFQIKILSGGEKTCNVVFPSNEQWCERARKQKAVRRLLGRGKSQYDSGNANQVDAELFAKIRKDQDGAPFDEYEASKVIDRLERCQVTNVERQGNTYRVEMKVPGALVVHVLNMPTQKDITEYGRGSVKSTDSARSQEIRMSLEPALALWQRCSHVTEGYAEGITVPVIHMDAAIVAMLTQMDADLEDPDPED